jgi:DNA-binding transcriptional ArsR family regulator
VQIVQFGAYAPCPGDGDAVFKALADPTRRALLDRLRERNGQNARGATGMRAD